jgi:hypothetical protein
MPCLLAEHVSCDATADGAQQAALAFSHWRRVGVVVGRIRVARLWRELGFLPRCVGVIGRLLLVVLARCWALLIRLVLSVGVVACLTSCWRSWRAAVKRCQYIRQSRPGDNLNLTSILNFPAGCSHHMRRTVVLEYPFGSRRVEGDQSCSFWPVGQTLGHGSRRPVMDSTAVGGSLDVEAVAVGRSPERDMGCGPEVGCIGGHRRNRRVPTLC